MAYIIPNINVVDEPVAKMLVLSQAPGGALSASKSSLRSPTTFTTPNPPLFSKRKPKFAPRLNPAKPLNLTLAKAEKGVDSNSTTNQAFSASTSTPPFDNDQTVFVGQENVPLEGVIQFEKPSSSSRLNKWG